MTGSRGAISTAIGTPPKVTGELHRLSVGGNAIVRVIAVLLLLMTPSVAVAQVRLWIAATTDGRSQDFMVLYEESHPDYPSCKSAAVDYTSELVAKQGYEQLGSYKVRTPLGKTPGYQYLELHCGDTVSATEAARKSVKKLTDQYRELGDAIRRATPQHGGK